MIKKENTGGAPTDNKNGVKLKNADIRQLAYLQYCEHLAKGKSKKSWCFDHPEFRCTWETIEKYIRDEVEFDPLHKKIAEIKGFAHWEQIVEDSAIGKNKHANTASLQMLMRNKFSWDKPALLKNLSVDDETVRLHETLMAQIAAFQNVAANKREP